MSLRGLLEYVGKRMSQQAASKKRSAQPYMTRNVLQRFDFIFVAQRLPYMVYTHMDNATSSRFASQAIIQTVVQGECQSHATR